MRVSGLLPQLRRACWSNYEWTASRYKTRATGIASRNEGLNRGDIVHEQLRDFVNEGWEIAEKKHGRLHPYTKKAVAVMNEWKWRPIIAELTVYDPTIDIATKVDCVCLDANDDIVLVEWKCGMDNYICRGNGSMQGPLGRLYSNCPLNQALVQLLFTQMFVENGYGVVPRKAYVVQIHSDGIEPYDIPSDMRALRQACYDHVAFTKNSKP